MSMLIKARQLPKNRYYAVLNQIPPGSPVKSLWLLISVNALLFSHGGPVRRRAEKHNPGKVSKIITPPAVKIEQAEISLQGIDPLYGKIRIINFLTDEMGKQTSLKEGDGVDVAISSDEIEPEKRGPDRR